MDWQKVERELGKAFRAKPERIGESLVIHRRRPLELARVMESAMTEEERAEHETLTYWKGTVSGLLEELGAENDLLTFYWGGFGPGMSSGAGMALVGTGRRRYVGVWEEEAPHRLFAAVEPWDDPLAISSAVSAFLVVNGRRHGYELFGSLPSQISNDCPELLPTPVVKQALFDYMEGDLDRLVERLEEEELEEGELSYEARRRFIDGWFEEAPAPSRRRARCSSYGSSYEARRRLFDEWFERAYVAR